MSEQSVTITAGYGQFFRPGDVGFVGDEGVRILRIDGDTLIVRRLRWYERAWHWLGGYR